MDVSRAPFFTKGYNRKGQAVKIAPTAALRGNASSPQHSNVDYFIANMIATNVKAKPGIPKEDKHAVAPVGRTPQRAPHARKNCPCRVCTLSKLNNKEFAPLYKERVVDSFVTKTTGMAGKAKRKSFRPLTAYRTVIVPNIAASGKTSRRSTRVVQSLDTQRRGSTEGGLTGGRGGVVFAAPSLTWELAYEEDTHTQVYNPESQSFQTSPKSSSQQQAKGTNPWDSKQAERTALTALTKSSGRGSNLSLSKSSSAVAPRSGVVAEAAGPARFARRALGKAEWGGATGGSVGGAPGGIPWELAEARNPMAIERFRKKKKMEALRTARETRKLTVLQGMRAAEDEQWLAETYGMRSGHVTDPDLQLYTEQERAREIIFGSALPLETRRQGSAADLSGGGGAKGGRGGEEVDESRYTLVDTQKQEGKVQAAAAAADGGGEGGGGGGGGEEGPADIRLFPGQRPSSSYATSDAGGSLGGWEGEQGGRVGPSRLSSPMRLFRRPQRPPAVLVPAQNRRLTVAGKLANTRWKSRGVGQGAKRLTGGWRGKKDPLKKSPWHLVKDRTTLPAYIPPPPAAEPAPLPSYVPPRSPSSPFDPPKPFLSHSSPTSVSMRSFREETFATNEAPIRGKKFASARSEEDLLVPLHQSGLAGGHSLASSRNSFTPSFSANRKKSGDVEQLVPALTSALQSADAQPWAFLPPPNRPPAEQAEGADSMPSSAGNILTKNKKLNLGSLERQAPDM